MNILCRQGQVVDGGVPPRMDPRRPPLDLRQPLPSCAFFPRVRSLILSVAPVRGGA